MVRVLRPASEDEMIAEYLRQEYASGDRYGPDIARCLALVDATSELITCPDLTSEHDNRARKRVFALYRGYGELGPSFFTGFPVGRVDWSWVAFSPHEVLATLFTQYWAGIWESDRTPRDLARRIRERRVPAWVDGDGVLPRLDSLMASIAAGHQPPPLIVVSADGGSTRVVMEGHTRLTAFALAEDALPPEVIVLLGRSAAIARWEQY